jgi:glycosyltransferase involved in cell wall biosynthesis
MNNSRPLVSVIMTAFNEEKHITEAIESVLNQTYENLSLLLLTMDQRIKPKK